LVGCGGGALDIVGGQMTWAQAGQCFLSKGQDGDGADPNVSFQLKRNKQETADLNQEKCNSRMITVKPGRNNRRYGKYVYVFLQINL
jgi:hypothetical protein